MSARTHRLLAALARARDGRPDHGASHLAPQSTSRGASASRDVPTHPPAVARAGDAHT
jgi:hypothetical protein